MGEKAQELHDSLVNQLCVLCFGEEAWRSDMHKSLIAAWMQLNGLGVDDIKEWFDK